MDISAERADFLASALESCTDQVRPAPATLSSHNCAGRRSKPPQRGNANSPGWRRPEPWDDVAGMLQAFRDSKCRSERGSAQAQAAAAAGRVERCLPWHQLGVRYLAGWARAVPNCWWWGMNPESPWKCASDRRELPSRMIFLTGRGVGGSAHRARSPDTRNLSGPPGSGIETSGAPSRPGPWPTLIARSDPFSPAIRGGAR